jgi:prepilin-type N-terminal cleavage/methylation domain-containing protein
MTTRRSGFTLIELLIVVVLIGILAAIAIPKYRNSKEQAFDAAALSDLRNLMTSAEAYFSDYQRYPASLSDLPRFELSDGVTVTRFQREMSTGVETLHIHIEHANSSSYYHIRYPVDQIEKRKK